VLFNGHVMPCSLARVMKCAGTCTALSFGRVVNDCMTMGANVVVVPVGVVNVLAVIAVVGVVGTTVGVEDGLVGVGVVVAITMQKCKVINQMHTY
jgi:hypothetical protein